MGGTCHPTLDRLPRIVPSRSPHRVNFGEPQPLWHGVGRTTNHTHGKGERESARARRGHILRSVFHFTPARKPNRGAPRGKRDAEGTDDGCAIGAVYGVYGSRRPEYCSQHEKDGMVNVAIKKCRQQGCTKQPSFGVSGT